MSLLGRRDTLAGFHGHADRVIGRVEKTVLDCSDPRALATFYAGLFGFRVNEDDDGDW